MLDALTLDQLRTFVAIAEARSFRAAAARLSHVQSAVSQAIANLEGELGVRLFDRSGYRPALTPEGRALLADARAILLKVDTMRARARGLGEGLELTLPIALDPQFPLGIAAAALKDLHDTYPSVSVLMWTSPLGASIVALREGRCALAITAAEIPDPDRAGGAVVRAARRGRRRSAPACGPSRAERASGGRAGGPSPDRGPRPVAPHGGARLRRAVARNLAVSDNETKRALILAGVGWGSLPLWLIERDLAEGRLVRIAAAEFGQQGETFTRACLAHRTDQPLGPAARAFRQALLRRVKAWAPDPPAPGASARRTCPGHRLERCSDLAYGRTEALRRGAARRRARTRRAGSRGENWGTYNELVEPSAAGRRLRGADPGHGRRLVRAELGPDRAQGRLHEAPDPRGERRHDGEVGRRRTTSS